MMTAVSDLQREVENLSLAAQNELRYFLQYLRFKYQAQDADSDLKLGGLWSDLEFDVKEQDVRVLRQQISQKVLRHN